MVTNLQIKLFKFEIVAEGGPAFKCGDIVPVDFKLNPGNADESGASFESLPKWLIDASLPAKIYTPGGNNLYISPDETKILSDFFKRMISETQPKNSARAVYEAGFEYFESLGQDTRMKFVAEFKKLKDFLDKTTEEISPNDWAFVAESLVEITRLLNGLRDLNKCGYPRLSNFLNNVNKAYDNLLEIISRKLSQMSRCMELTYYIVRSEKDSLEGLVKSSDFQKDCCWRFVSSQGSTARRPIYELQQFGIKKIEDAANALKTLASLTLKNPTGYINSLRFRIETKQLVTAYNCK